MHKDERFGKSMLQSLLLAALMLFAARALAVDAPSNVIATANSQTGVSIAWSYPANSGCMFYLYTNHPATAPRAATPGAYYLLAVFQDNNTTPPGFPPGPRSANDTGLVASSNYSYFMEAQCGNVTSGSSNIATATTLAVANAPTDVSATVISQTQIDIAWNHPASSGCTFLLYANHETTVPRTPTYSGAYPSYRLIASFPDTGARTYSDTGLVANSPYSYYMQANCGGTTSASSSTASDSTFPLAPTPTNLTATVVTQTRIDLAWSYPAISGCVFKIYANHQTTAPKSPVANQFFLIASFQDTGTRSYSDTGLSLSSSYSYRVEAVCNSVTSAQAVASATTPGVAPAPTNATATVVSQTQIDLAWSFPAGTGCSFSILANHAATGTSRLPISGYVVIASFPDNGQRTYSDTGLGGNSTYGYYIQAICGGTTTGAPQLVARTLPLTPATISATGISQSRIDVTWTYPGNSGCTFLLYSGWYPSYVQIASIPDTGVRTFSHTGLVTGTTYTYIMQVNCGGMTSPNSNTVGAYTLPVAPAPTDVTATSVSPSAMTVTWSHPNTGCLFSVYANHKTTAPRSPEIVFLGFPNPPAPVYYLQASIPDNGTRSYSDTGLIGSTSYTYSVKATCSGVESASSLGGTGTTAPPSPTAPTNLAVSPGSASQIVLTWTDNSSNETGFNVERKSGANGAYAQIAVVGAGAIGFIDAEAPSGATYYYRLRASNGGYSGYSNEASIDFSIPGAPGGLAASINALGNVSLSWIDNGTNETGFKLERKAGAGTYAQIAAPSANASAYVDSGLTVGTLYSYRVRATNAVADSANSNEISVTYAAPSAPSGMSAGANPSGGINLAWSDNSNNESGFKLERKIGATGTYVQLAALVPNTTSFTDLVVSPGLTYFYRIRGTNPLGDSAPSNEASVSGYTLAPNATGGSVTYKYDHFGNLVQTNAGGVITTVTYDTRGRKIDMTDADMGTWKYSYDALGQLVKQTDARNKITTIKYDLLGRMTLRTEDDLISKWFYDAYPDPSTSEWNSGLLSGLTFNCAKGIGKLCYSSADNSYRQVLTYDDVGRPSEANTFIDNPLVVRTTYDAFSRVATLTYPGGFAVRNGYQFGHLSEVRNNASNALLWSRQSVSISPSGTVIKDQLGDQSTGGGVASTQTYDTLGRLASSTAGAIQNLSYQYDAIGNVAQRIDSIQNVAENFQYDTLNRLLQASGPNVVTRSFDYDAIGNLTYKSDVGTYSYGAPCGARTCPHAVAGTLGTVNTSYVYDDNGNLTSGGGRTIGYTSFNLPLTIGQGSDTFRYTYSPNHERVRLEINRATGTYTTIYLHPGAGGLLYEKETRPDGTVENRHYVNAAGLVGVYVTKSSYAAGDGPGMRYYHRDQLGSITAVSNDAGAVTERLAYEAFGKRRFPNGTADPGNAIFGVQAERGFTAHEHLDEIGLIHMNGRVYDPLLGRFMTADPIVQAPGNLQAYNRYSYAFNNPLGYVDPTGHSSLGHRISQSWKKNHVQWLRTAAAIAVAVILEQPELVGVTEAGVSTMAFNTLAAGFAGGYIASGGDFEAGFNGALFAGAMGVFAGPGGLADIPGGGSEAAGSFGRAFLHAAAGCLATAASGDCAHTALSAGVTEYAVGGVKFENVAYGVTANAVVGGTVGRLSGGNFANGALTGAFGYLFNQWAHLGARLAAAAARLLPAERAAALEAEGLLAEHEGVGHTLTTHAGRTEAQLAERLAAQPGIDAASTFTSRAVANYAFENVLTTNAARISEWMASTTVKPLVLEQAFAEPIGAVMTRGAAEAVEGTVARFVLLKNPYTFPYSWVVLTGYVVR